jgi:L-aspartate oxidase
MTRNVGLERSKNSLLQAFIEFDRIERESEHLSAKLKDMILISRLITYAAIQRNESRGTHFRNDYTQTNIDYNKSNNFNVTDMNNFLSKQALNQNTKSA